METTNLQPHNLVETPLSSHAHLVLLNLLSYYSRIIMPADKDNFFYDLLKDGYLALNPEIEGQKNYLDVPYEEKIDFFKDLSYFFKNMDNLVRNENVRDWVWNGEESAIPFNAKK